MPEVEDRLADPNQLPSDDALDLGDGVAATWAWADEHEPDGTPRLLVWHFCDHRNWDAARRQNWPNYWRAAGVGAHELVSRDPLHLEPSLYWPDCCGKHGFVRDGRWTGV